MKRKIRITHGAVPANRLLQIPYQRDFILDPDSGGVWKAKRDENCFVSEAAMKRHSDSSKKR